MQDIVAGRVASWSQVPGSARTDPIVPVALDQAGPRGALRRFLRWARTSRVARRVIATRYMPFASAR